jgi:hypothetical protein
MFGEIDHMLAGAAAGLDHVAGFAGKEFLQARPDRPMIAVIGRRVEAAVGWNRTAVPAEFDDVFSHISRTSPSAQRVGLSYDRTIPFANTSRLQSFQIAAINPVLLATMS